VKVSLLLFAKACFSTVLLGVKGCAEPAEEVAGKGDDESSVVEATNGGFQEFVAG
jgi:hypothetical protein